MVEWRRLIAALAGAAFAPSIACTFDYDALGTDAGSGGGATSVSASTASSSVVGTSASATSATSASSSSTSSAATSVGATSTGAGAGGEGGGGDAGGGGGHGGAGGAPPLELPRHCDDIATADPAALDGEYLIDPDGDGGSAPFTVLCDMTIDGGGWTRFNWLGGAFPTDSDPLARELADCAVADESCPGRIPAGIEPTHLLVKDLTDQAHAAWMFDGSTLSNAIRGALRDKTPVCIVDDAAPFAPYLTASIEPFCSTMGGCDSFKYTDSECSATGWILTLDDDSHWWFAAFKIGKATGGGNCGAVDWGFLDAQQCMSELGELYFR